MTQILSMYPLTDAFRARIETRLGERLTPRILSDFRQPSLGRTWLALRTLGKEPVVLASEDPGAKPAISLLITIGGLFARGPLRLNGPEGAETRPSRWHVPAGLLRLLSDSLHGRLLNRALMRELGRLEGRWRPVPWRRAGRIAYLKTNLWFGLKAGGSVGHVAGVINGLLGQGEQVTVYANEPQPLVSPAAAFRQVPTPSLCSYPAELNLVRYHQAFLEDMLRLKPDQRPDWIYQRLSLANYVGAVLSRAWGLPLVVEYNGSEAWVAKNWGKGLRNENFTLLAEEAMLRQATLVVAVSEVLGEELLERGLPEERIFVHPNCVDPDLFTPDLLSPRERLEARAALGLAEDDLVVTFLGTFGPWHGVTFLAQCLRRLYAQDRPWLQRHKVRFLLVGDGAQRKEVEDGAPGLARASTFTGLVPQAEAPRYLALSDSFLSPHPAQKDMLSFGSPTKLFEYMAMGKAIVASRLEQIGDTWSPSVQAGAPEEGLRRPGRPVPAWEGRSRLLLAARALSWKTRPCAPPWAPMPASGCWAATFGRLSPSKLSVRRPGGSEGAWNTYHSPTIWKTWTGDSGTGATEFATKRADMSWLGSTWTALPVRSPAPGRVPG